MLQYQVRASPRLWMTCDVHSGVATGQDGVEVGEKADGELSRTRSWAVSPGRRRNMQANRHRDTGPELAIRRLLHAQGLRYRVDQRPLVELRRKADIVFTRIALAVFIDGCYWHGCPEHYRQPSAHVEYWSAKIAGNVARDADTNARLAEAGWTVLRIWEHEEPIAAARRVADEVRRLQEL
ncbi:very short patch repair endonuclease [Myceligenerans halotolerans]